MTTALPAALRDYAARLLIGTELNPEQAHQIASGHTQADGSVQAALRDGWANADTATHPDDATGQDDL